MCHLRAEVTGNRITLTSKFCSPLNWVRRKHILDKVTQVHHWHWVLEHFDAIIRTAIGEKMHLQKVAKHFNFCATVEQLEIMVTKQYKLDCFLKYSKNWISSINTGVQFLLNHSNVIFIRYLNKCNKLQMRSPASHMLSYSLLEATSNTFHFNESQRFLWHSTATRRVVS